MTVTKIYLPISSTARLFTLSWLRRKYDRSQGPTSLPMIHDSEETYQNDLFDEIHRHTDHTSKWGDNLTHKEYRTIRVYFQNINGLPSNDHWDEWNHVTSHLKRTRADIDGFNEPDIKWTK